MCSITLQALALGASAVFVGRLPAIGASLGGKEGAQHAMLSLLADTQCTMINTGCGTIPSITRGLLVRAAGAGNPPFMD